MPADYRMAPETKKFLRIFYWKVVAGYYRHHLAYIIDDTFDIEEFWENCSREYWKDRKVYLVNENEIPMSELPPAGLDIDGTLRLIRKNYGQALDDLADL